MIKISKQNNSLIVEGIDNVFYPNNGDNSYPLNSLIVVTDNSDMATFRSVATNDVLFSGLIKDITINGEAVTKDNIIQKFDAVSNSSTGGGGGTVDAYTKEEADNKFASKDELTNVQTVANDADTKVNALTTRVEGVETTLGNKQDTLVSGTNIKTINNESVLGEGNIEVSGGIKTYEASEIPSVLLNQLKNAVFNSQDKKSYINSTETDLTPIQHFLDNLSNGDYLKLYNDNATKVQFVGNGERSTGYQFNIIVNGFSGSTTTIIYSNYITVILFPSSSQMRVSNNSSVPVARVTDISILQNDKQDLLVSGTNIKTINNQSILGNGNLEISGGNVDLTNYYTKTESDAKYATKDELTAVETVANNADTKADAATSRVESVETSLGNKQDILVSGTNIKTINSQSIIGSGDLTISGVSEEQAQEIAKIPTLETEIAQKANVSDVPTVQTDYNGTNKKYIYSSFSDSNYSVYSNFTFRPNEKGIQMVSDYWGSNHNRTSLFQIPLVTTSKNGVMSAVDKTKLDSIPETIPSQSEIDGIAANVSALQTAMDGKQPTLVSGTNIKTINGNSILGEGNLAIEGGGIDLSNYYNKTEVDTKLDTKQNTLVSGTNIKTINSQSILGEGNLEVTIPDATTATSGAMSAADKTKLDSISTEWTGTQSEYDALTTKDDNIIYYVTE